MPAFTRSTMRIRSCSTIYAIRDPEFAGETAGPKMRFSEAFSFWSSVLVRN